MQNGWTPFALASMQHKSILQGGSKEAIHAPMISASSAVAPVEPKPDIILSTLKRILTDTPLPHLQPPRKRYRVSSPDLTQVATPRTMSISSIVQESEKQTGEASANRITGYTMSHLLELPMKRKGSDSDSEGSSNSGNIRLHPKQDYQPGSSSPLLDESTRHEPMELELSELDQPGSSSPILKETKIKMHLVDGREDDDDDDTEDEHDGNCKKRKRTTPAQRNILEASFNDDPLPSKRTKERLAQKLGISHKRVQIWFQNRRAKEKREKKISVM